MDAGTEPLPNPPEPELEPPPEEDERPERTIEAWLLATFFGVGFTPKAPGTTASAATVLLWGVAAHYLAPAAQFPVALAVACLAIIAGIPCASIVCRETGRDDPQIVVVDEVAGQMITLLLAPTGWKALVAGFILFRIFDTLKPFPLRRLEKLPEGSGVMMDDVGAGIYGFVVMQLLLYFHLL